MWVGTTKFSKILLHSLDDEQRASAIISDRAPRDILLSPGQAADRLGEPQGLAMSAMNEDQRSLVMELLGVYISNLENSLDQAQLDRIVAAGIEHIHFAWAGSGKAGEGHYYRLHGPTFVIEYDNVQGGANHIHSVFRDLENDFGGDALAEHYRNHHSSE